MFIVDDDEAVRDSIQELVSSVGLSAEVYASAQQYLETFDPERPGCLVLDVRMARLSGRALQAKLNEIHARIPIVFISGHGDIPMAVKAIKAGAVDFVQKPYHEQQLLDSIDEALRRDAAVRHGSANRSEFEERLQWLTGRERKVMDLAVQGLSSKAIAKQLDHQPPHCRSASQPPAGQAGGRFHRGADAPRQRTTPLTGFPAPSRRYPAAVPHT